jgi:RNA polymerase sigma-70 factor (ECF subfamily)
MGGEINQQEQIQRLFVSNIGIIRGFIWGLVPDRSAVDDILQETFVAVSKLSDRFEIGTNFSAWACSVARFKVMDYRREGKKLCVFSPETLVALCVSPEAIREDPRRDHLDACLKLMPQKQQDALRLRYGGQHKPPQIAKVLGWKLESVYVILSSARSQLKSCILERIDRENAEA